MKREPIRWRYLRYARRIASWRRSSPAVTTSRLSVSLSASPRQTAAIASATPAPQSSTRSGSLPGPSTRNSWTQTSSSSPVRRVESSSITRSPRSSSIGIASESSTLAPCL